MNVLVKLTAPHPFFSFPPPRGNIHAANKGRGRGGGGGLRFIIAFNHYKIHEAVRLYVKVSPGNQTLRLKKKKKTELEKAACSRLQKAAKATGNRGAPSHSALPIMHWSNRDKLGGGWQDGDLENEWGSSEGVYSMGPCDNHLLCGLTITYFLTNCLKAACFASVCPFSCSSHISIRNFNMEQLRIGRVKCPWRITFKYVCLCVCVYGK